MTNKLFTINRFFDHSCLLCIRGRDNSQAEQTETRKTSLAVKNDIFPCDFSIPIVGSIPRHLFSSSILSPVITVHSEQMSVNGYNGVFSTGGGVNGGSVGHGNGGGPPGRPRSRNAVPVIRSRGVITKDICCYGCGEVVTANVTITSCQCTFCDDCMQQFMGTNDHCPSCGTKTESTDFSEVCVTNYADGVETIDKDDSVMDAIMAFSAKEGSLTHQQMARNLFREFEKHDRRSSFVIRQLSNQASKYQVTGKMPAVATRRLWFD